jgi:hypothetical protein
MRQVVIALCLLVLPVGVSVQDGRWKLGGDGSCYFDANDSGPNQCEPSQPTPSPQSAGRWKLGENDSCYFDPNDSGPDQCTPPASPGATGRWKLGADGACYFDANDSGANQCEPAKAATRIRR